MSLHPRKRCGGKAARYAAYDILSTQCRTTVIIVVAAQIIVCSIAVNIVIAYGSVRYTKL